MENRRAFIRKMGTLAISLPFYMNSSPLTVRVNKPLGVCLVGLGEYSAGNLAPALSLTQYCKLSAIVTGSPEKIPIWQKQYRIPDRNVYSYDNFEQIAGNPDIDVVYIVLPTGLHAKYAVKAANAGKHVWCEKPMARNTVECQAIINACRQNKVKLSIGYRMQHEPNTRQFIQWAKQKPYGKIEKVKAEIGYNMTPPPNIWRMSKTLGGGYLYDLGVYSINGLRYTTQEEPLSIQATYFNSRPDVFTEIREATTFTMEFPSGIVGYGKCSAAENLNLLRVECKNGWYQLLPFQTYDGISGKTSDGKQFQDILKNQQAWQMDQDALAILNNAKVLVGGEEGMRDIRLLEAINFSAASGEKVIL